MRALFEEFGAEAEAGFDKAGRSPDRFTNVAAGLLDDWSLQDQVSLAALWTAAGEGQLAGLGDSSKPGLIPLFTGPHVRIVAHLWSDAADRLHQHDWTGAFQVLEGQSFNARFDFDAARDAGEFTLGTLKRRSFAVFDPGHIQPVEEGSSLIHSVVYPGKPGLAISLRVVGQGPKGAFEYLRPGLRCPSHRRREASAVQIDLLSQMLQTDEAAYAERFAGLSTPQDDAALIRLLDAAAFDSLPLPEEVIEIALDRLPEGARVLAALDDIERSDKTRELLGEHDHPKIRAFICALFHSESRTELSETLRIAGSADPVVDAGRALSALVVDDESGELPPDYLVQALGEAALTGDIAAAIGAMRAQAADAPLMDAHSGFVGEVFEAMEEAPIFRCLFKA
ncbi:hypothetical protein [Hyphobacterium sp.]|uniref:hypothetical protein n=1 Tax=Hyphobacterium sp. TaxID=2004662 RepID=UPI00374879D6